MTNRQGDSFFSKRSSVCLTPANQFRAEIARSPFFAPVKTIHLSVLFSAKARKGPPTTPPCSEMCRTRLAAHARSCQRPSCFCKTATLAITSAGPLRSATFFSALEGTGRGLQRLAGEGLARPLQTSLAPDLMSGSWSIELDCARTRVLIWLPRVLSTRT